MNKATISRLCYIVIETIVPDDPAPNWERILDMHMLAIHASKARTQREYADLFAAAFLFEQQIDTRAGVATAQTVVLTEAVAAAR